VSVSKPLMKMLETLADFNPPKPRRASASETLSSLSHHIKVSRLCRSPLRDTDLNMNLEISTEPLGIEPDCCQPSVRDINTGKLFVNEKMHS
jgi:hypothetical protein